MPVVPRTAWLVACLTWCALAGSGCYEWVQVPPQSLPSLDSAVQQSSALPEGHAPMVVVEDMRGKPVEVMGEFAVKVTTGSQSEEFMSPLHCSVETGHLRLAEGEAAPRSFALAEVRMTEVYHREETLSSVMVAVGISAAVLAAVFVGSRFAGAGSSVK